jgi:hypothetical protein
MSQNRRKNSKGTRAGIPPVIYGLVGALALVVLYRIAAPGLAPAPAAGHHPEPRDGLTAETVVAADQVKGPTQVAAIYAAAREIPEVLDGLYCHCDCSLHAGHRSLLTCFETDHAAACDICLEEGRIAAEMTAQGHSLEEIRARIDALNG